MTGWLDGNLAWWRDAVFYQVYPRSFQDSTGDGIGDLQGIIDRLDYLNDGTAGSLGVDALWLTPVFPSPQVDVGYDVAEYCDVDPAYGDLATMDRLIDACHRRGMKVLLDLVPNHTSDRHPWFLDARSSRSSRHRRWYTWRDPRPGGGPPNNWHSVFGGPAWTLDEATGQYYLHSFLPEQPDLDWRNPEVVAAMHDVVRFWLRRGVDGFRIDALGRVAKEPGLPDNPPNPDWDGVTPGEDQLWLHNRNHPDVFRVARELRAVFEEFPGTVSVGEVFGDDDEIAAFYGGERLDGLHLAFNFHFIERRDFRSTSWRAPLLGRLLEGAVRALPDGVVPAVALANHDRPRFITRHNQDSLGEQRARAAALFLLGLPAVPFLYYGEEIGMADVAVPPERQRDGARLNYPDRDPCRTPMPWDGSPGRGFSLAEPWLPHGPLTVTVAAQDTDPGSLLNLYRHCIWARRAESSLRRGGFRALEGPGDVLAFERGAESAPPVVVVVNTGSPATVPLPPGTWRVIAHSARREGETFTGAAELGALEAAWLRRDD